MGTTEEHCPECGGILADFWPKGLCPQCALADAPHAEALSGMAGGLHRVGDYEILEELARGGMGIVFKARQASLQRTVALKVLLLGSADRTAVRRLRAEALAAAALQHPNIVAIHEVGVENGRHYLAMDLIDGPNLAQLVRDEPLPNRLAAECTRKIAEAIQHAHEHGILHRDLKPANVILDDAREPHVTDFGLAKRVSGEGSITLTGQVLGSPNYMAPEQARGDSKITAACDVYGLGAILYHLLTARPPAAGQNFPDTIRRVIEEEPISLRLLNPSASADLETICLKCLEKDPGRRYSSAREVSRELARYLNHEPIHARPLGPFGRSVRWARRHRAASVALLAFIAFGTGSPVVSLKIARERRKAEENNYVSNISLGLQALDANNFALARQAVAEIAASPVQSAFSGWEMNYLRERCRSADLIPLASLGALPAAVAFSPDDKVIASITEDGVVQLWDAALRRPVQHWQAHKKPSSPQRWHVFHSLVFDPKGRRLFSGGSDGSLKAWDVLTRQLLFEIQLQGPVTSLDFAGDGRTLAAASISGPVALFNVEDDRPADLARWSVAPLLVDSMVFTSGGSNLAIATERTLQIWDVAPPSKPRLTRVLDDSGMLASSPAGRLLASSGPDFGFRLWQAPQFTPVHASQPGDGVLAFSPSGDLIASGGGNGNLMLISAETGQLLRVLSGQTETIRALAFSHDGKLIVSASADLTLALWNIPSLLRAGPKLKHGSKIQDIRFLQDSLRFVTLGLEISTNGEGGVLQRPSVKLWHVAKNAELAGTPLSNPALLHNRLSIAPDENSLAVNDFGEGRILRLPSLTPERSLPEKLTFTAQKGRILFACGREIGQLDAALTNRVILGEENGDISTLVVAPDGSVAVTRRHDAEGEFTFWDLRNPGKHILAREHRESVIQFAFSPDSQYLATASWDGTVGLWDVRSRRLAARLRGHANAVDAVAFSPDGQTLASGAQDGAVRLWNVKTRRHMAVLHVEERGITALAFSPDGQWLAGGGANGALHLWFAPSPEEK